MSLVAARLFIGPTFFLQFIIVCRNMCERLYSRFTVGDPVMEIGINIVDVVKYISFIMAYFVLVAV